MEIVGKILLKGLVVGAYLLQGLALHDDEVVVSAVVVEERFLEDLAVGRRQPFLLRHLPGIVAHASFEHDESEERHHVVWEVALLDGSGEEQVGYRPYLTLIVHDIGHARRIAAGSIFVEQIVFCHIHFQFLAKNTKNIPIRGKAKGEKSRYAVLRITSSADKRRCESCPSCKGCPSCWKDKSRVSPNNIAKHTTLTT